MKHASNATLPFEKITIIGLGLMGGSLLKAIKKNNIAKEVWAYDKFADPLDDAKEQGLLDEGFTNLSESVKDSQMIIICSPLGTYEEISKEISGHISKDCIITDIGSVKNHPSKLITDHLEESQLPFFVPAHPIAGSEKSGFNAACGDLYQDKLVIITPTSHSSDESIDKVIKLWELAGAKTKKLSAQKHDAIYAQVSHAPQLLAFSFLKTLHDTAQNEAESITSFPCKYFQKFFRICSSNPAMWKDIFKYNQDEIHSIISRMCHPERGLHNLNHLKERAEAQIKKRNKYLKDEYSDDDGTAYLESENQTIFTKIMPLIILLALIEDIEEDFLSYAGNGLRDFSCALFIKIDEKYIEDNKEPIKKAVDNFISNLSLVEKNS